MDEGIDGIMGGQRCGGREDGWMNEGMDRWILVRTDKGMDGWLDEGMNGGMIKIWVDE